MDRLLFYHDFASPYCRLALRTVTQAAERTGLVLRAVPFELRPAPTPLPTPDEFSEAEREELATARTLATEWDVPLGELRRVPRTRKAHEAVAYAREHDAEEAMLNGIYEALWDRDLDIARLDVLADIAEDAELDRDAVHIALGLDDLKAGVRREEDAAAAAGLSGVPAVQIRDVLAVGLFRTDELVEWIEANR